MNAAVLRTLPEEELSLRPISIATLDEVLEIERRSYEFPWTRVNFIDSLAAGYRALAVIGPDGAMRAYDIAMGGVEETHLLNLTVAPPWRRRGLARMLLDDLVRHGLDRGDFRLWLEVRASNAIARTLYESYGFRHVGMRRGYYPATGGAREDAMVMRLALKDARARFDGLD
jgi:ribosomal-protein-alanine N-acetyltransferase